jgi:hypothetical protein
MYPAPVGLEKQPTDCGRKNFGSHRTTCGTPPHRRLKRPLEVLPSLALVAFDVHHLPQRVLDLDELAAAFHYLVDVL